MNAIFILDGPTWSKEDEEERSGVGEEASLEEESAEKLKSTTSLGLKLATSMESEAASSTWDEKSGYRVSMMSGKQQFGMNLHKY